MRAACEIRDRIYTEFMGRPLLLLDHDFRMNRLVHRIHTTPLKTTTRRLQIVKRLAFRRRYLLQTARDKISKNVHQLQCETLSDPKHFKIGAAPTTPTEHILIRMQVPNAIVAKSLCDVNTIGPCTHLKSLVVPCDESILQMVARTPLPALRFMTVTGWPRFQDTIESTRPIQISDTLHALALLTIPFEHIIPLLRYLGAPFKRPRLLYWQATGSPSHTHVEVLKELQILLPNLEVFYTFTTAPLDLPSTFQPPFRVEFLNNSIGKSLV